MFDVALSDTTSERTATRPARATVFVALAVLLGVVAACEARSGEGRERRAIVDSVSSRTVGADTQRVTLAVGGMYCESCVQTITAMLRRSAGVVRADVSFARREAVVVYDAARTSPDKIADVIAALGYKATVKAG